MLSVQSQSRTDKGVLLALGPLSWVTITSAVASALTVGCATAILIVRALEGEILQHAPSPS